MAIFNQVVKGGGTTPTGTISITSNGAHDVTNYATADVNVPTTAPAHYLEKTVDANGIVENANTFMNFSGIKDVGSYALAYAYYRNTGVTGVVDLSEMTSASGAYGCDSMFYEATGVTEVDLSSLTTVSGASTCYSMFYNCTGIVNIHLENLTSVTGQSACQSMFSSCSLTSADLSSLTTISGVSGCYSMFIYCNNLTTVDLSSLTTISGQSACSIMFSSCRNLSSIDLSSLTEVTAQYAMNEMLSGGSKLQTLSLPSLVTVSGPNALQNLCNGNQALTTADLSSLTTVSGSYALSGAFAFCTNLTSLSFPSITPNSFETRTNQFSGMCSGITNITLHFPSNTQAKIETLTGYSATAPFGATAGTVLFDLPATNTLTGADLNTYSRNPKYDTATSLAWKVGAYGTTNFTPAYYTSGTTDPTVSDAIYSDAACTQSVTTITAIA